MRSTSLMWPAAARPQPAVQDRRAPALAVLQMAAALEPDPVEAMTWYHGVPIAALEGLTAATLVKRGRADAVLAFLRTAIELDQTERQALQ